jgi:hypothetical protein
VIELSAQAAGANGYDYLTTTVGLALIGVLAVLLLARELLPILRTGDTSRQKRAMDLAIVPLLVVFAVIVLARLAELLK